MISIFLSIKMSHDNLYKFEHFTLHLLFMTVMCNILRRGHKILNPRPTLRPVEEKFTSFSQFHLNIILIHLYLEV